MDATPAVPDLDPRRDTVACAALLLAMVMSVVCAMLIADCCLAPSVSIF